MNFKQSLEDFSRKWISSHKCEYSPWVLSEPAICRADTWCWFLHPKSARTVCILNISKKQLGGRKTSSFGFAPVKTNGGKRKLGQNSGKVSWVQNLLDRVIWRGGRPQPVELSCFCRRFKLNLRVQEHTIFSRVRQKEGKINTEITEKEGKISPSSPAKCKKWSCSGYC